MAWLGLPVLRVLAEGPRLSGELAEALGISTERVVIACRCLRARAMVRTSEGVHQLTDEGRRALACGEEITCGPDKGKVNRGGSLRARAWRAMRIKEKFGLDELLSLLCDGTELSAEDNLRGYLLALERSGYLVRLNRRGADNSPRWWLSRNTGPNAPAWNRQTRTVADTNTGEVRHIETRRRIPNNA